MRERPHVDRTMDAANHCTRTAFETGSFARVLVFEMSQCAEAMANVICAKF